MPLYGDLKRYGYWLIFKPVVMQAAKGNVDVELAMHTILQIDNYERAIIVSGDGDFYSLLGYLHKERKLFKVLVPNKHFSRLLKDYGKYLVRLDLLRHSLEFRPNKNPGASGRSKP